MRISKSVGYFFTQEIIALVGASVSIDRIQVFFCFLAILIIEIIVVILPFKSYLQNEDLKRRNSFEYSDSPKVWMKNLTTGWSKVILRTIQRI
jgi:hypothetical protein